MYRAFTILIPLVGAFGGAGYLGYWLGARRKPSDLTPVDRQRLLKAHADILGKAREAHMNGDLGLAMMYEEAAETLWKETE
jgi:hypothetical protein